MTRDRAPDHSDPVQQFRDERVARVQGFAADEAYGRLSGQWLRESTKRKYEYNFEWLGRPIIQFPQDMIAIQEVLWNTKPELVIETGIAHGGSLIFHASILKLLGGERRVLGIDVDIRRHNRKEIESHPLAPMITMFEGSSIDAGLVARVRDFAKPYTKVMVILDSMHTHAHVLRELELYSPLVTHGCYIITMDTLVEDMGAGFYPDRPWGPGDNPKTAVWKFLETNKAFEIDRAIQHKLMVTAAPDGYLKRVG